MILRQRLRQATQDAHQRVDGGFSRYELQEPDSYRAFLQTHALALPRLEDALEGGGALQLLPDWPERRRVQPLLRDLRRLGAPLPEPLAAPDLPGRSYVLGALYVLEGSRLGGRLLLEQVRESHDPVVRSATEYLGHGAGMRFWPTFLPVLGVFDGDEDQVVDGARRAFACFEAALQAPAGAGQAASAKAFSSAQASSPSSNGF